MFRKTLQMLSGKEEGQSLVEFSLSLVLLLIVVCGLLDLGRLYFTYVALEDSAGEAALYLSIHPGCVHSPTDADSADYKTKCANPNNAEYRARNVGNQEVDWLKANITFDMPEPYGVGDTVGVNITYSYALLTPIIPKIVGVNPITLSTEASQIIITQ